MAGIYITKTYLYNFDPLKPHFYIVKLGFTGVYIIFLISARNIDCGYSLEPPRRGGSKEYPQSIFWAEIWKILAFLSENFQFLEMNCSIYLNRRVFVMTSPECQFMYQNIFVITKCCLLCEHSLILYSYNMICIHACIHTDKLCDPLSIG